MGGYGTRVSPCGCVCVRIRVFLCGRGSRCQHTSTNETEVHVLKIFRACVYRFH